MDPAVDVLAVGTAALLAGMLWCLSEDFFDHYGLFPWKVPSGWWCLPVGAAAGLGVALPSRLGLAALLGLGVVALWLLARLSTWQAVIERHQAARRLAYERPLLAGWFTDPCGEHDRRYFDGRSWTEWVVDRGERCRDAPTPGVGVAPWNPAAGLPPPPAWRADPSGRYDRRWWDGLQWTELVHDGERAGRDPGS